MCNFDYRTLTNFINEKAQDKDWDVCSVGLEFFGFSDLCQLTGDDFMNFLDIVRLIIDNNEEADFSVYLKLSFDFCEEYYVLVLTRING